MVNTRSKYLRTTRMPRVWHHSPTIPDWPHVFRDVKLETEAEPMADGVILGGAPTCFWPTVVGTKTCGVDQRTFSSFIRSTSNCQSYLLPFPFIPTNTHRALARPPLVMFKHVVPKASTRQLLRPASQADAAFRASPSTFYLVDRLQQRRGYATPAGTE